MFLGSFFITSNVDSSVIDLYENKNSNNNLLIAGSDCGGSGSGGGMSPAEKKKRKERQQKTKDAAKKRIIKSKLAAGKPLTDKEKEFATNQVINIFKAIKISLKNGNEAVIQAQLKELFFDYKLDIGIRGDGTPDNILRMIEMGDEGIDILIKNFESGITLLTAKSKVAVSDVLTDEENYIIYDNASKNPDPDGLSKEFYDYFKNNNINTKDTAINELKKLKKAIKDKDEDLILKIKYNFLVRVTSLSEDETFDDNFLDILNNTGEGGIDLLIKTFELGGFEKYK